MRKFIFVLFALSLLLPSISFAAACTNLTGIWNVTGTAVYYNVDAPTDTPTYTPINNGNPTTVNVISQNGCLLAGYVEYLPANLSDGPADYNFTGAISGKIVTLNLGNAFSGTLTSSKKMTFICAGCDPGFDYQGYSVTLTGVATKR